MGPSPFKHPAVILANVRDAIEPSLSAAGFEFDGRHRPQKPIYPYLDYSRPGMLFRLAWDRRNECNFLGMIVELLDDAGEYQAVATLDFSGLSFTWSPGRIATEVTSRIEVFVATFNGFLSGIAANRIT
jgi:hypothetical protein